jgi:hypothetical protein
MLLSTPTWQHLPESSVLIDINHKAPARARASLIFVRYIMAALATVVIVYMIDGIKFGWTFTFFGGLAATSDLLCYMQMKKSTEWKNRKYGQDADQHSLPIREDTVLADGQEDLREKRS